MSRHQGRRGCLHRTGRPTYRLVRFVDELVVLVKGTKAQVEAVLVALGERVASIGLRMTPEKAGPIHIDEGFTFLGQRIISKAKGRKRFVHTFVGSEALASVMHRVKALTKRSTSRLDLVELLRALDPTGRPQR